MDFSQEALRAPFSLSPFIIRIVILVPTFTFLSQYLLYRKTRKTRSFLSVRFFTCTFLGQGKNCLLLISFAISPTLANFPP